MESLFSTSSAGPEMRETKLCIKAVAILPQSYGRGLDPPLQFALSLP